MFRDSYVKVGYDGPDTDDLVHKFADLAMGKNNRPILSIDRLFARAVDTDAVSIAKYVGDSTYLVEIWRRAFRHFGSFATCRTMIDGQVLDFRAELEKLILEGDPARDLERNPPKLLLTEREWHPSALRLTVAAPDNVGTLYELTSFLQDYSREHTKLHVIEVDGVTRLPAEAIGMTADLRILMRVGEFFQKPHFVDCLLSRRLLGGRHYDARVEMA
jgi:hypothetical protein